MFSKPAHVQFRQQPAANEAAPEAKFPGKLLYLLHILWYFNFGRSDGTKSRAGSVFPATSSKHTSSSSQSVDFSLFIASGALGRKFKFIFARPIYHSARSFELFYLPDFR